MTTQIGSVKVNQGRVHKVWFNMEQFRSDTIITADTVTTTTDQDKQVTRTVTASAGEQVTLSPTVLYNTTDDIINFTYSSDNPTKINVDTLGNIVYLVVPEETSSANITVTAAVGAFQLSQVVNISLQVSGAVTIDTITGGVAGSAREELTDTIDTALSGANVSTQQSVYTSQNHTSGSYTRNSNFFLQATHAEALTCASPWNSIGANTRAGTAITARHALLASHYPIQSGATLRFVASDNTVITRTVVQASSISTDGTGTDAWMVLLDSDLPSSITPCKIFPSAFTTYLPASSTSGSVSAYRLPLLAFDFEEKGIVLDLLNTQEASDTNPVATFNKPENSDRLAFHESIISGDSGNPVFAVAGTELWLLSTFHTRTSGPAYNALVPELNAMISTLDTAQGVSTGYTVTEGDLSSFTTY